MPTGVRVPIIPAPVRGRTPRGPPGGGSPVAYPLTAILSDLHGNLQALEVALEDASRKGVRRLVCLGDVVGYGARPVECLERVRAWTDPGAVDGKGVALEPGVCLLGNHEQALLEGGVDFNPRARAAIDWTREHLWSDRESGRAWFDWLGSLRPEAVDEAAHFAHGSPRDPVREYVTPRDARDAPKLAALFAAMRRDVCFVGHSHIPGVYFEDGRLHRPRGSEGPFRLRDGGPRALVNVGSVGQPRDRDVRLSYALFDGEHLTFVRLEYDVRAAQQDILAIPELPTSLAERLSEGT